MESKAWHPRTPRMAGEWMLIPPKYRDFIDFFHHSIYKIIGENWQENPIFTGKIDGFPVNFRLKPIEPKPWFPAKKTSSHRALRRHRCGQQHRRERRWDHRPYLGQPEAAASGEPSPTTGPLMMDKNMFLRENYSDVTQISRDFMATSLSLNGVLWDLIGCSWLSRQT